MSDTRRMQAYNYGFDTTGVDAIDKILSAVACAGKAYHHTEYWYEKTPPYDDHRGETPVDWIQNAALDAAQERLTVTDEQIEKAFMEWFYAPGATEKRTVSRVAFAAGYRAAMEAE